MVLRPLRIRHGFRYWLLVLLPVVVLAVPQGVQDQRNWTTEAIFVTAVALLAATTLARVAIRSGGIQRRIVHPALGALLLYIGVVNPLWSATRGNDAYLIAVTSAPFLLIGVFYLVVLHRDARQVVRASLNSVLFSGCILAVVIVVNYAVSDLSSFGMRSAQIEGDRTLVLPLLAIAGVLSTARVLTERTAHRILSWSAIAATMIVAILMTVTRAMLLAYLVGTMVFVVVLMIRSHPQSRWRLTRRLCVGLVAATLLPSVLTDSWVDRLDLSNEAQLMPILGRADEYAAFTRAFLESPILGKGLGSRVTDPESLSNPLRVDGVTTCHSHLFFLAGTSGIVGIMLYYSVLSQALWRLWVATARSKPVESDQNLFMAILGAATAGIVYTMTSTMFSALSYNLFLGLVVASGHVAWSDMRHGETDSKERRRG